MTRTTHPDRHRSDRIDWLRAAVLGANDGIVSTTCLVVGVAAASAARVTFCGPLAMAITAGVGSLFGAVM
jgi:VIT1/CCC1 family predicted Fe2+/Mn2+ transporter